MRFLFMAILCVCVSLITSTIADGDVLRLFKCIKKIFLVILPINFFQWGYESMAKNNWLGFNNEAYLVMLLNIIWIFICIVLWLIYNKKYRRRSKYELRYGMSYSSNDSKVQNYWIFLNFIIVSCIVFNLIFTIYFIISYLL